MSNYKDVEVMGNTQIQTEVHKKTWYQRFRGNLKYAVIPFSLYASSSAFAAPPDIDIVDVLAFIVLIIAAVATVSASMLMVSLTAKGFKAVRQAF